MKMANTPGRWGTMTCTADRDGPACGDGELDPGTEECDDGLNA
jgi:hypothetical protein